ncbi:response regulator [bacterium]|nr:response regulator [bacterium]
MSDQRLDTFHFEDSRNLAEMDLQSGKDEFQNKIRVVLLDWSDVALKLLKNEIEKDERIRVIGMARNAHEARNMVVALDPDLLIIDILSPCSGGIEFIKRLNRFNPKPVLLLTPLSKLPSGLAISAFEAGIAGLIDKDALGFWEYASSPGGFNICRKIREMAS